GPPGELEVAIRGHRALRQLDPVAPVSQRRRLDRVVRGGEARERRARIELDREADRIQWAARRMLDGRRDARCIRYLVRVGRPADAGRRSGNRRARDVAWAHDHREPQTELPRVVSDGLLILDLDADRGAGSDVGDRRGEDVRPLLLDEARTPALLLGLLVLRLRGGALLDDAFDQPVAD